jgi:hypothetical protein
LNQGCRGGKPAANRLNYDVAEQREWLEEAQKYQTKWHNYAKGKPSQRLSSEYILITTLQNGILDVQK